MIYYLSVYNWLKLNSRITIITITISYIITYLLIIND